jgi:hypothetical protein
MTIAIELNYHQKMQVVEKRKVIIDHFHFLACQQRSLLPK